MPSWERFEAQPGFRHISYDPRLTTDVYSYQTGQFLGSEEQDLPSSDSLALYESTFAHEWQHLEHYYTDPFEGAWINEGLSDFAQTLTGYVDGTATVFDRGADSHLYCYQGFGIVQTPFNTNPRDCGGPENSLTLWGESPNPNAILADYGHAYSFLLFLFDRYGAEFMSRLHSDGEHQGLASVDAALEAEGVSDMYKVLHDHQTMTLVDKIVGGSHGVMLGVSKGRVTTPSLRSTVYLANPATAATPGAAPSASPGGRPGRSSPRWWTPSACRSPATGTCARWRRPAG